MYTAKDIRNLALLGHGGDGKSALCESMLYVTKAITRLGKRADGTTVSVRPSGTEPKIKFYFGVKAPLASVADYERTLAALDAKIEGIRKDLRLE